MRPQTLIFIVPTTIMSGTEAIITTTMIRITMTSTTMMTTVIQIVFIVFTEIIDLISTVLLTGILFGIHIGIRTGALLPGDGDLDTIAGMETTGDFLLDGEAHLTILDGDMVMVLETGLTLLSIHLITTMVFAIITGITIM